jgi:hypothetical protein
MFRPNSLRRCDQHAVDASGDTYSEVRLVHNTFRNLTTQGIANIAQLLAGSVAETMYYQWNTIRFLTFHCSQKSFPWIH